MALRFATKAALVSTGPNTFAHGLPLVPDEYWANLRNTLASTFLGIGAFPATTSVDATNVYFTANQTGLIDLFAAVNHSIVK